MSRPILPLRERDPALIGDWALQGRVGAGGMGVVYLARRGDGTAGALKVIADHLVDQDGFRTRFEREIEILRRVEGLGLARVLDADSSADPPFVVTEFVDAPNLQEHIRAFGPLSESGWSFLAAGLLAAVEAIHAKGVLHRDIKPTNVLLADAGPVLIDFGIAAAEDKTALTAPQMLLGTPEWLAPERMSGAPASPASDIFSLGGLLAYAGTGRAPFAAPSPAETMQRVVSGNADLAGLPPAQANLVLAMLAPDPTHRPTPRQAAAMLPRSEPPTPPPPTVVGPTLAVPSTEAFTTVLPAPASLPGPTRKSPWRTVAIVAGVIIVAGLGLLLASWLFGSDSAPDSFESTCNWDTVDDFGDGVVGASTLVADCDGIDVRADEIGSSGLVTRQFRLVGSVGDLPLSLTSANGLDWNGTLGTASVRLLGTRADDLSFSLQSGSLIGDGTIGCRGPAPADDPGDQGIGQDLEWANPSTVTGSFTGDDRVGIDEAGALCNLVLVGVPASALGDLDS